jgi:cytidylate kinase
MSFVLETDFEKGTQMDQNRGLTITIDGPAGAGKSTVAKALAKCLSYLYLDTGALYRAIAYKMLQEGIDIDNEPDMVDLFQRSEIALMNVDNTLRVFVDGEDLSEHIRTEAIGLAASKTSANSLVRQALLAVQRQAGVQGSIIAEGRDMGSIVFPHADVKFFLDAGVGLRVTRRYKELIEKGIDTDMTSVEKDLQHRDKQDRERAVAPLTIPDGAIVIDSSNMNVTDVVATMVNYIKDIKAMRS